MARNNDITAVTVNIHLPARRQRVHNKTAPTHSATRMTFPG
jgi:hypothetical protein